MHPLPSPAWANFSIMMECMPESGRCHSVCILFGRSNRGLYEPFKDKDRNAFIVLNTQNCRFKIKIRRGGGGEGVNSLDNSNHFRVTYCTGGRTTWYFQSQDRHTAYMNVQSVFFIDILLGV